MESLPGEASAAERLKQTALRDFGVRPPPWEHRQAEIGPWMPTYRFDVYGAALPSLYKYALTMIGCAHDGPSEKILWCVFFTYRGERCTLAMQKLGLRTYISTYRPQSEAEATAAEIAKKLNASMRTVERLLKESAPELLARGLATVKNQHSSLSRAYSYFRKRAERPDFIEDLREELVAGPDSPLGGWSFQDGKAVMRLNAFHDMIAAITAYLSLLEHDLVLALPFCGFDPDEESLTDIIGWRWGLKWDRVFGDSDDSLQYKNRLFEIVEKWRNPYSHGGFERGHGATIWLHTPGVNAPVPIGLTRVRDSPVFSFSPGGESTIAEVFSFFDELDGWVKDTLPEAVMWRDSDLDVRFDSDFREMVAEARRQDNFAEFVEANEYLYDRYVNMDF